MTQSYLTAKKIYPGNWAEALNGWYRNIDVNGGTTLDGSNAGPTSVLATPGYRYFQQRGYVKVTHTSGTGGAVDEADVIIPSPYKNDVTRQNITGMYVSGSTTLPIYGYRATINVGSGWDGHVSSGIYAATGNVISFGLDNSGSPTAASGVGESTVQANLTSTVSGEQPNEIFFAAGSSAFSTVPMITTTGTVSGANCYFEGTGEIEFKVYAKESANATSTSGGFYISEADAAAGKFGYIIVELCYIQPDVAADYNDIEAYLTGPTFN